MLTIVLYIIIPKGFFPTQDTGVIQGISQAPATISFAAMEQKQQELAHIILQDPAVESLSSFIGADGTNTTLNSGRMSINLKPLNERDLSASDVIRRLQTSLKQVEGIELYMEPVQNITVDDRVSRTQYQYTLEDPDANELNLWTGKLVDKMKQLPQLADVATDQQTGGLAVSLVIDRVTASRLGIAPSTIDNTLYDAYGQRQISTMYTQLNQYHVILETDSELPARSRASCRICISRPTRPRAAPGQALPRPSHPRAPRPPARMRPRPSVAYTPSSRRLTHAVKCDSRPAWAPAARLQRNATTSHQRHRNAVPLSAFTILRKRPSRSPSTTRASSRP